eukprot:TRINITY_DN434_c0_g1_i4.p1 TRINITY_DN434_c0_g1~~TRINITY_DN434_c0_g1_i4.p1  ORF type:complete len:592 (+),score=178.84 TRINITY_DN434_c0_g1_i4:321-2096(+)
MSTAEELKVQGNAHLQKGEFLDAVAKYTQAIKLDPSNHVLYSNRSAAYTSSSQYKYAESDARKCVELNPNFAKGYGRVGAALVGQHRYEDALAAYREGLDRDPNNQALKDGAAEADAAIREAANPFAGGGRRTAGLDSIGGMFGPQLIAKMAASPQHAKYLADPEFMSTLQQIQQNPQSLNQHLQDPRILEVLSLALGGSVRVARPGEDPEAPDSAMGDGASAAPTFDSQRASASGSSSSSSSSSAAAKKKPAGKELTPEQKEAQALKDEGNALYKKRDFEGALASYAAALEKDPEGIVYSVNRLSVLLEMGQFDQLTTEAEAAIEKARSMRPLPFDMVGKCLARIGAAKERQGDLEGAIQYYKRAMTEHRSADTLKKLQSAEKEMDRRKEEAYWDPALGLKAKEEGNAHFKAQRFPEAVASYTEAIKRAPKEVAYYTNRAAAYTKLMALDQAMKDCEKALELDPTNVRAMNRKGKAYMLRKELTKALECFDRALKADPENAEATEGKAEAYRQVMQQSNGGGTEEEQQERMQRAMADPEIQDIMMDPMMKIVLNTLSTDPAKGQDYLRDPTIAAKLNKLVVAGVVGMKSS